MRLCRPASDPMSILRTVLTVCLVMVGVISGPMSSAAAGEPATAQVLSPALAWDSSGALATVGPLDFDLTMDSYSSISQIAFQQPVRLHVEVTNNGEEDVCGGDLQLSVEHQGEVLAGPKWESIDDDEMTTMTFTVPGPGTYNLVATGAYQTNDDAYDCTVSTEFKTSIPMFTLKKSGPGPVSTEPVKISSSGGHVIVAHPYYRSADLRITYRITDPAKRSDLLYTICYWDEEWESGMSRGDDIHDIYEEDCFFKASRLKAGGSLYKTSTGWTKTWDQWWQPRTYSQCRSLAFNKPKYSTQLVIANKEGTVIATKRHVYRVTCL